MRVECGDFKWEGDALNIDDALKLAFANQNLPENPSMLVRVNDGQWNYIDFRAALKIAGYKTRNIKNGFKIL